ncbi:MAG: penicillin-binding protein 1A [Burkholderiales bacterium]|nr:penicillin-binding protein 1A [Burkholderiales bacterium]
MSNLDNFQPQNQYHHSPKSPKKKSWIWKIIFLLITLCGIGAAVVAMMIAVIYPKLPSMDELRNYQPKLPLQVFSADGVLLGQFGEERRIYVDMDETPRMLINAILSAEDERFYEHKGVDFQGVMRAVVGNLASGHLKSGGSTITMQVARNFFLTKEKTFTRKFNEVLLSYKIENSLTKDQILSLYINQIYLGQRAYGFAEASQTYFGKPLDKLSVAQYAILAGLPKAPSAYNPVVNPKRAYQREVYVLGRMLKHGYISQEQYDEATKEKIFVIKGTIKDSTDAGGFIAEMVRQYLYPTYGDEIYTRGFKVYTTIDSKMQQAAYVALRNGLLNYDLSTGYNGPEQRVDLTTNSDDTTVDQVALNQFDGLTDYGNLVSAIVLNVGADGIDVIIRNGDHVKISGNSFAKIKKLLNEKNKILPGSVVRIYKVGNDWNIGQLPKVQGALVSISPQDGAIKALMGGFDFTYNNFNHVIQAKRQPGSSIKPFIYSAALDRGYTTGTVIDDSPACFPNGTGGDWCPRNDDNQYMGPISLRQALTFSRNLITVKILNSITPQYAISYLAKFGFAESQFQPYLTMGLGANEVTPLQMAQAYSVFANGGYKVDPYFITKITDSEDKVLAETKPVDIRSQEPAISPRNAFIMDSVLRDVAKYGTGSRAYKALQRGDIAGKTGTTNDSKDVWFDGYTPNLATIVWVGYDQPKSLGRQYGATLALPIWVDFMRSALANIPQTRLSMPDGITAVPDGTWRGDTEYYYSDGPIGHVDASGVSGESDADVENILSAGDSEPSNQNNQSAPEIHTEQQDSSNSANSSGVNTSDGSNNSGKVADINDIIKNIRD